MAVFRRAANDREPPKVLLLYFSYTGQTQKAIEAMSAAFAERGCDVTQARIEFTDPRYADRFSKFPLRHPYLDVFGMLPAQLRRATGEIRVPEEAEGAYDLVCIGSPTWWLTTSMPIRSFLKSRGAGQLLDRTRFAAVVPCRRYWRNNLKTVKELGTEQGGDYVDGIHFSYEGGQVRSLLSLLSFLGKGERRERYLGVRIPPTNLRPHHLDAARAFAGELAERLSAPPGTSTDQSTSERSAGAEQKS